MAGQGGSALLDKVRWLLRRDKRKPALKPNKPLVLRDAVANCKPKNGEASCITEMSILMACWKQNNFVDSLCSSEINAFYTCVKKAEAAQKSKSQQGNVQGGRLTSKQATTLLTRFPNPRKGI
ncbi:small ribosomal subunit protein mS37 [Pholidichthys leucotaenia]